MTIDSDFHSHVSYSSARQMVQAGREKGLRVRNPFPPPTFDKELERLAAEATSCEVALEINGYDVLNYPSLVRRLIRGCALHGTPVSVGSDAHYPRSLAQAHRQTEGILRVVGISKVRIRKRKLAEEYEV